MSATHPTGCCRIAPQSGVAFRLRASEILRINDPFGEQVADLFAFADNDHACSLSSGRTIDYASRIYLTKGDVLYANDSRPMFRILEDSVGRHDFLLTPCSQEMFESCTNTVATIPAASKTCIGPSSPSESDRSRSAPPSTSS